MSSRIVKRQTVTEITVVQLLCSERTNKTVDPSVAGSHEDSALVSGLLKHTGRTSVRINPKCFNILPILSF